MSHLKTAHDIGVQKALKEAGYASIDDVHKEAEAIGIVEKKASNPTDGLLALLGKK